MESSFCAPSAFTLVKFQTILDVMGCFWIVNKDICNFETVPQVYRSVSGGKLSII